jgi:hypothetical protein
MSQLLVCPRLLLVDISISRIAKRKGRAPRGSLQGTARRLPRLHRQHGSSISNQAEMFTGKFRFSTVKFYVHKPVLIAFPSNLPAT